MTITIDAACGGLHAVEHLVQLLDEVLDGLIDEDAGLVVSTHPVREPTARFVVACSWPDEMPPEDAIARRIHSRLTGVSLGDGTHPAAIEHAARRSGRLARYPGRRAVETRTTVADAVASSCIDAVVGLAGVTITPGTALDLTGFARPTWQDARCTLLVQHGRDSLIPFEVREQVACCSPSVGRQATDQFDHTVRPVDHDV